MNKKIIIIGAIIAAYFLLRKKNKGAIEVGDLDAGEFVTPTDITVYSNYYNPNSNTKGVPINANSADVDLDPFTGLPIRPNRN